MVAAGADGTFLVVWLGQDGGGWGGFGKRYDSAGQQLGTEFQVNSYTPGNQFSGTVAALADGAFVVAWSSGLPFFDSTTQDGSASGVFGQRLAEPTATPTLTPTATDTPAPPTPTPTLTPTATPIGACPATVDGGCTTGFEKGGLLIKEDVAGKEKLVAKMVKGPALTQTAFGNPISGDTVYSLCIYDDAGNLAGGIDASVIIDRAGDTCGGVPCWSAVGGDPPGGKGYKYLDAALASDGVLKILYKGGGAGKSKAIVKGKGPNLPDGIPAALLTSAFATVQLRANDGICLSVTVDDIKKQTAGAFKAKK